MLDERRMPQRQASTREVERLRCAAEAGQDLDVAEAPLAGGLVEAEVLDWAGAVDVASRAAASEGAADGGAEEAVVWRPPGARRAAHGGALGRHSSGSRALGRAGYERTRAKPERHPSSIRNQAQRARAAPRLIYLFGPLVPTKMWHWCTFTSGPRCCTPFYESRHVYSTVVKTESHELLIC